MTNHFHLVVTLRTSGAIPLLPLKGFMTQRGTSLFSDICSYILTVLKMSYLTFRSDATLPDKSFFREIQFVLTLFGVPQCCAAIWQHISAVGIAGSLKRQV